VTTRSYLFAPNDADSATTRLIATAAQVTGFMKGASGGPQPGWYVPGADNTAVLAALDARLAHTYPEAGPAFRAVRLWTNFLWQPAYIAVIASHIHGSLPNLAKLTQRVDGIYASGYRLTASPQTSGTPEQLIAVAGAALRPFASHLLEEINIVTRLKPLPARHLFAHRIISLLERLAHWQPHLTQSQLQAYSLLWLEALDLTGQARLDQIAVPEGRSVLITTRKGCCLDFRVPPLAYCSSCPKQGEEARIARQTRDAVAEQA